MSVARGVRQVLSCCSATAVVVAAVEAEIGLAGARSVEHEYKAMCIATTPVLLSITFHWPGGEVVPPPLAARMISELSSTSR